MQPDEAERFIIEGVSVTRQKIAIMKGLIFQHGNLDSALKELDATRPTSVVVHATADAMPILRKVADWISYSLAGCEAIWELVHSGAFVQLSSEVTAFKASTVFTMMHGGGGMSASWDFDRFKSAYPSRFIRSWASDENQVLADADLYLQKLSVPNLHPEIEDALRDAVRCFKTELFTPSVVMLGKASEGAWIELGVALAAIVGPNDAKAKRYLELWAGNEIGFAKKLRDIVEFYATRQDKLKTVAQRSGIRVEDLRMAMLWSDTLRDARNAIHHRVSTSTDATYEIVATLLLAAVPHLQTIYRLYQAARSASESLAVV